MQLTGLSRMTVRQAIAELVHEGMLRRDQGRGTFVADSRITRLLSGHSSFRDVVQGQGSTPSTKVVRQVIVPANALQATLLQVEPDESLLDLVRVRLIDSEPVMVDYTHVPLRLCPNAAERGPERVALRISGERLRRPRAAIDRHHRSGRRYGRSR